MPLNTVYVGRPTKWGNPYPAGRGLRTGRRVLCPLTLVLLWGSVPKGSPPQRGIHPLLPEVSRRFELRHHIPVHIDINQSPSTVSI